MARSEAQSVDEYLAELPPDRRDTMSTVRKVVLHHLPDGYVEIMEHGMIEYVIPLERYPVTYNKLPLVYAALAAQKNYYSLYLMNIYADQDATQWFTEAYRASGNKLDMGKACVRFKKLENLPLGLIGEAIARTSVAAYIERYEASRTAPRSRST